MKKTISNIIGLGLVLILGAGVAATAQSADENKTTIQVTVKEKKDGRTEVKERRYEVNPMSDSEQKKFVDKVLDSLGVDGKGQQQVSIIVNDNEGKIRVESRGAGAPTLANRNQRQRVEIRSRDQNEPLILDWRDGEHQFHFDTDELRSSVRRMQRDLEPGLNELRRNIEPGLNTMQRRFEGFGDRMNGLWTTESASSIRSLNTYPNNPDNNLLNLRFSTPDKGDVHITVTDTQGKEVGKKTIKDFSGEFVGQIELKKNTRGTLFVTVVQNEDGMVRRVVIK
ncbi:T9SS type A sorting domain-containing protein [Salmonirosea aquatica]|uniref:T9SS type A sorting domain-containing protein n=1 Tax=Salmonirosea aquatica TaxID=2654236 RepID=A0A7C9FCQ0_9BACT|nr:T9SS type A sorting domain-containing protein [Cytophagaceae bacterium SJW1-29]